VNQAQVPVPFLQDEHEDPHHSDWVDTCLFHFEDVDKLAPSTGGPCLNSELNCDLRFMRIIPVLTVPSFLLFGPFWLFPSYSYIRHSLPVLGYAGLRVDGLQVGHIGMLAIRVSHPTLASCRPPGGLRRFPSVVKVGFQLAFKSASMRQDTQVAALFSLQTGSTCD
jgi:hypothetical protein